ncbi:formylglycine-generating enzyme family protein [Streptomyces sp. CHA1]|nr:MULTISPECIES: SUMF1/EgtB/PvdO family nonheme iron enzyme [unclassified Streptomyces]UYM25379.1 formylglycine-generating enzyme family protein [Streptomyces albus]WDV31077.1 formylglycine-generating enzyme family protein [Streptomyces sp. AD16]WSB23082.1 formylglycine-generating enzyme family protein [Streptomyces albidoflavus]MBT3156894.1 formylglycine-generating enzyme family protein [Streptomyces sp. G11C]MCO6700140.1 formylglycine-generating enzyme family protein [Streptomyces sp. CHB9.2
MTSTREVTRSQAGQDRLLAVPAGEVVLRDEAAKTERTVAVDAFELGACPVTRERYEAVTGTVPAGPGGPDAPVTEVSWTDALRYCNLLSQALGLRPCYLLDDDPDARATRWDQDADGFRLPTEAEWEYACRAGSPQVRYGPLDVVARHRGNSGGRLHPVATRQANAFGLYDMLGNVWEWCWDLYDPGVYGPYRVFRGGGWQDEPRGVRAACRRKSHPTLRIDDLGFRPARSV